MANNNPYPKVDVYAIMERMAGVMSALYPADWNWLGPEASDQQYMREYKNYSRSRKETDTLHDTFKTAAHRMMAFFDEHHLSGNEADAFKNVVIPKMVGIVLNAISAMNELEKVLANPGYRELGGGYNVYDVPDTVSPTPASGFGYCAQRVAFVDSIVAMYDNWMMTLQEADQEQAQANAGVTYDPETGTPIYPDQGCLIWVNTQGDTSHSSNGKDQMSLADIVNFRFDEWIRAVLNGQSDMNATWNNQKWCAVGSAFLEKWGPSAGTSYYDQHFDNASWMDRNTIFDRKAPEGLANLELDPTQLSVPKPYGVDGLTVGDALSAAAWKDLQLHFATMMETIPQGKLPGTSPYSGPTIGGPPNFPVVPPPIPPLNPNPTGDPTGAGSGSTVDTTPVPRPTLQQIWGDKRPNQFPEPLNLGDLAREMVRRQGGRNHLLLITHMGPRDQNNWLVTIPDVGNKNYIQDPGDPGMAQTGAQSHAVSSDIGGGDVGGGSLTNAADVSLSEPVSASSGFDNTYLNNMHSVQFELGGHLSSFGRFVAEAIQQYCTSQLPAGATNVPNDLGTGATTINSSGLDASGYGDPAIGSMVRSAVGSSAQGAAQSPSGPPTSPQFPANLWLAGHGLGGMVAQNLASANPFPGDNLNLAPAHVVKGVIALGAPIVGTIAKGVAYSIFRIKGDRIGDIPVDTVGVNDQRAQQVHVLDNPFQLPPWQTSDPSKPNYVKDANDPATIHGGYADSDVLTKSPLPFDNIKLGGGWGPTYVVPIPQAGSAIASSHHRTLAGLNANAEANGGSSSSLSGATAQAGGTNSGM